MRATFPRALLALAVGLAMAVVMLGVAPRLALKVAARAAHAISSVASCGATVARAEDMKFEPLPPESADALTRRATRRAVKNAIRGTIHGTIDAATGGSTPPPPDTPDPDAADLDTPEPPTVTIGKSGDIMRMGSDIEIPKGDVVTGDVMAVGGDVTIAGHVEGNAVSMGGDIYLQPSARVDGDVVCMGGELHEEDGAIVGGKRVVGLGSARGKQWSRRLRDRGLDVDVDRPRHRGGDVGGAIGWLLVWLLIAWAIVKITPGRTTAALESFRASPGSSFLIGWLAIVLTVPGLVAVALLTALLCITIIGIPLGIAVLFAYFLFLAVFVVWGGVVGSAIVGERVSQRRGFASPSIMRAVVTGVIVMNGLLVVARMFQAIPFLGGLGKFIGVLVIIANALIGVTGWGALLRSEFTTGFLARWWHGRRGGPGMAPAPAPPAPVPPPAPAGMSSGGTAVTTVQVPAVPPAYPVTPVPPPPAPPSPPGAFMPPAEPTPPPGPTPGT